MISLSCCRRRHHSSAYSSMCHELFESSGRCRVKEFTVNQVPSGEVVVFVDSGDFSGPVAVEIKHGD
jgi:hypothetical protein